MTENRPTLEKELKTHLLDLLPMAVAAVDRDQTIVYANPAFEQRFGPWQARKRLDVYRDHGMEAAGSQDLGGFGEGQIRVTENVSFDIDGRRTRFTRHTVPVKTADGNVPYVMETFTDISTTEQIRREYQLLFDQVPCSVLIIDRDFRILKTNRQLQHIMGQLEGGHCFQVLKGREQRCTECTARQTFEDGRQHSGHHVWRTKNGRTVHLHVITVPLRNEDGNFNTVMELAVDITKTVKLEDGLKFAHSFLETMISTAMDGLFALDQKGKVRLLNPAARRLLGLGDRQILSREELAVILPKGFLAKASEGHEHVYWPQTHVRTLQGEAIPVRLVGTPLNVNRQALGMAFSVQDLRAVEQLEKEKLEAQRMAVVGQTVAGLAHGIKNLVVALEGGLYMLNTGIRKGQIERVEKGIRMLTRNIDRIGVFVKTFLNFSKQKKLQVSLTEPNHIAREVVEMYTPKASQLGIALTFEPEEGMRPAALDYEGMHECLANLVDNAVDAAGSSEAEAPRNVWVRSREEDGAVIYEVADDGCGMDYDLKKKVFTSLFTTKGLNGTGLGLLITHKVVQAHGGKIAMHSEPGKGTTFSIILPRIRLPRSDDA